MIYPSKKPNKRYEINIPNLTGGLNVSVDETLIKDNQCADMSNFWLENGVLKTRPSLIQSQEYETELSNDKEINLVGSSTIYNIVVTNKRIFLREKVNQNSIINLEPTSDSEFIIEIYNTGRIIRAIVFSTGISAILRLTINDNIILCSLIASSTSFTLKIYGSTDKDLYIPTTVINKNPDGTGGDIYEDFNILTGAFKEEFIPRKSFVKDNDIVGSHQSETMEFVLSNSPIVISEQSTVKIELYGTFRFTETVNGNHPVSYYAEAIITDENLSYIKFYNDNGELLNVSANDDSYSPWGYANSSNHCAAIMVIMSKNVNSYVPIYQDFYLEKVVITAHIDNGDRANEVKNCTFSTWFGGSRSGLESGTRLFVSGNPDSPNLVRYSDLQKPNYFPENNFIYVGSDASPVTAFAKQDNFLAIFKPNEVYAMEYNYSVSDKNIISVMFPETPISPSIGCDCPNSIQLINDKLVWAHSRGAIYTLVSATQYSERSVRELSENIRPLLKNESQLKTSLSADYNGKYMLFVGDTVYLWDYDSVPFSNYASSESTQERLAWFKWTLEETPTKVQVYENMLYITTENGFYELSGTGEVNSYIVSKRWDFGAPQKYKRIHTAYLGIGSDVNFDANVSYRTESGYNSHASMITNSNRINKGSDVFMLKPFIDMSRTFGFKLSCDKIIQIQSAKIEFCTLGEVN